MTRHPLDIFIQVARSLYEKKVQARVHAKFGNTCKTVTSADSDNSKNVKAFADLHDNKKGSLFGICPAYNIALEASFVEENDSAKPSLWPQIRAIVFRDIRILQQLERLMQCHTSAKNPHPRLE